MKIAVSKNELRDALKIVSRQSKTPSPKNEVVDLSYVRLDVFTDRIQLTCTNLERIASAIINQVQVEGDPSTIFLPVKKFLEVVQSENSKDITLVYNGKDKQLQVQGDRSKTSITTYESEWIMAYTPDLGQYTPAPMLLENAKRVAFSSSTDNDRPVLNGVLFDGHIAASDGWRIAYIPEKIEGLNSIIPSEALEEALVMFKEDVLFNVEKGERISITNKDGTLFLTTLLIQGNFPDVNAILPKKAEIEVVVDAKEFKQCLKRALVFSRELQGNPVRLEISRGDEENVKPKMAIFAENEGTGGTRSEIEISLHAPNLGDPFLISFNTTFLLEGLSHINGEQVRLRFNHNNTPGEIVAVDSSDPWRYVIMPMHL